MTDVEHLLVKACLEAQRATARPAIDWLIRHDLARVNFLAWREAA